MAIPRNLGNLAPGVDSNGILGISKGGTGSSSTTYCSLTTNVTNTLPVANGGTGSTTLTANNVIIGSGTSAVSFVAPGTAGNVLISDGTTWVSQAASGGAQPFMAFGSNGGY